MAFFFIRVDVANEAVYELVAEPVQEAQAEEQQEDAVEHAPEDLVNPADLQDGSLGADFVRICFADTSAVLQLNKSKLRIGGY